MATILTILADGFEEIEAVIPIDILRRAGISVVVAGLNEMTVRGSHGLSVQTDFCLDDFRGNVDGIVLPGGPGHKRLLESVPVITRVQDLFRKGLLCAAICAGPTVLGKAGILQGKNATCFPGHESQLTGATFVEAQVVVDGNVITSRGAGTAFPFALALTRYLTDSATAEMVASKILYR